MRKLFIGTMMVCLLGALAIGAVLAWNGSTPASPQTATAGEVDVSVYWVSGGTGNEVVPTNQWIEVAKAGINNTGDVDVRVRASAGSVGSISYSSACGGANNTSGQVVRIDPTYVPAGAWAGDLVKVELKADANLEDECQGDTINYDLIINVET